MRAARRRHAHGEARRESTLLVDVPIGLALTVAATRTVRESRAEDARSGSDAAAGLTVLAGVAARVDAIVNADEAGSGSPATLGTRGAARRPAC